jgi:hypothetical protein
MVEEPTWADGSLLFPSEYFFHDLDHARFKVREDLIRHGICVPDAYRDGSTVDPQSGRHRLILPFVRRLPRREAFDRAGAERERRWLGRLITQLLALPDTSSRAAELLLFEITHEKSIPIDRASLVRALRDDRHCLKLEAKQAVASFGNDDRDRDVVTALPKARSALLEICS